MSMLSKVLHFSGFYKREKSTMPELECPQCGGNTRLALVRPNNEMPSVVFRGIISCPGGRREMKKFPQEREPREITHRHPPYEWPITVRSTLSDGVVTETAQALQAAQSQHLKEEVRADLKQDLEEAERSHFSFCYKAAVVMCRRALQLALEEKLDKTGLTLGPLLAEERQREPRLFTDGEYALAVRIKDTGDDGAHNVIALEPKTVEVVIHDTARLLNKLYSKPAS